MKKITLRPLLLAATLIITIPLRAQSDETFPDGTPIPEWFRESTPTDITTTGRIYRLTDYGVSTDSTLVQTTQIQAVINRAAAEGGGVITVPKGTFLSGALFFKPGTHLHLEEGARLKGSDDIADFPVIPTRMEGQSLNYFAALINADGLDGFTLTGKGTIDGNGLRYWKAFWLRRSWNKACTNMDEQRPRLVYLSRCRNAEISGVNLINSPFWTTHLYRCERVRLLNLRILSPASPVKAPSTDAIDIDACKDIHVRGCYMAVNDDAVALKGGKGPWADQDPDNGANSNILIEDCEYGFCHGCLTCGSESIHSRNIVLRRIRVGEAKRLLWLKMRPDTPQRYEYIRIEDITGQVDHLLYIRPWTQFFDLKGRTDMPLSYGEHITLRNIRMTCGTFFNVEKSDQYRLSDFRMEDLHVTAQHPECDPSQVENLQMKRVELIQAQ